MQAENTPTEDAPCDVTRTKVPSPGVTDELTGDNHRRSSFWGRVNPEFGGGAIVKTPQVVNGGAQCGGVAERNDAGEGEIEHPQRLSQSQAIKAKDENH